MSDPLRHIYALSTPEGWEDRSLSIFSAPERAPGERMDASVVVSRERMEDDETSARYVERQTHNMDVSFAQFDMISSRGGEMNGLPAYEIRCRWMNEGMRVRQRIVLLFPGYGEVVSFAATADNEHFDAHEETFSEALDSLVVRDADGAGKS